MQALLSKGSSTQQSESWQYRTVAIKRFKELVVKEKLTILGFNHENIIPLVGYYYSDEENDVIVVTEYAENGSLYDYLRGPHRRPTWEERLKICIGAARGLQHLHNDLPDKRRVVHRDFKTANILLDKNLNAKLYGFDFAKAVEEPKVEHAVGTPSYLDDVHPQTLINLDRNDGLNKLIDSSVRINLNMLSFQVFKDIAHKCLSLKLDERPTMRTIAIRLGEALYIQNNEATFTRRQRLESYLIPLEEIKLATNNFSGATLTGEGGFGKVYKGQLSKRWNNCTVAIKSLNTEGHQGYKEFDMEVKLISDFRHNNIIPFIGYCIEDNNMIIVTEYASNHSLDYHLQDPKKRSCLTWTHRLKICLGAARGLKYLHFHGVIHRDVKSGNILLDENLKAKICDFGLSKENFKADQQGTHIYTKAAGTQYYLDPYYLETGTLRSASDVYSFGVVLFEILSGRMAYITRSSADGTSQVPLMNLVRRYHDEDQLEKLVDPSIANQINSHCLHALQEIAYKCISHTPKARPTMDIIVETIEDAIDYQLGFEV
ncbi:hypothetical protein LXL04_000859 [Taraxacum kok-saghyz]